MCNGMAAATSAVLPASLYSTCELTVGPYRQTDQRPSTRAEHEISTSHAEVLKGSFQFRCGKMSKEVLKRYGDHLTASS